MMCHVCGNELEKGCRICPWCETPVRSSGRASAGKTKFRSENIKSDNPTVEIALSRLKRLLHGAKADGVRILKIVHGYGSSGKGGEIRYSVRDYLESLKYSALIKYYVPGEEFGGAYDLGKNAVRELPDLKKDSDWGKHNKGITIIIL